MTFWVIDRKHFKANQRIIYCSLSPLPLAEGSKKVVNHLKCPKRGQYVMFYRFSPLIEVLDFEVRQKRAPKIGQKVMRDDFYPLAEG